MTRENFYKEFFEPYNKAVKDSGIYSKIPYNIWRTIRDWCCDHQWIGYDIGITEVSCGYHIMLEHNDKICPEIITVAWSAKPAFADYLRDHYKDVLKCDSRVMASLKSAVSTVSNATVAYGSCIQNTLNEALYTLDTKINEINTNDRYFAIGHDCEPTSIHLKADSIYIDEQSIPQYLENMGIVIKEKENNNNMKFGNFDFGPVDSSVRMSMYGMAIKNASGTYVAYDAAAKQVMDVDILNFEGANKFIYKMPVAIKDVRSGDVVIHARKPMFVQMVWADNRLKVLDIFDGEEKTIVLPKSPFGFDFVTKVVSLVNMTGTANNANPFGNMLPFLMLSEGKNTDDILPFLLMGQDNSGFASNPMLMYALMSKDSKMSDMLPFLLMSNCANPVQPTGCNCNCAADKDAENA